MSWRFDSMLAHLVAALALLTPVPLVSRKVSHDFDDPDADHSSAAIAFEGAGDKRNAARAFESAARFRPSSSTLTDLGVCKMRRSLLDEAEAHMLEALSLAKSQAQRRHVDENLNVLEQHLAHQRGDKVHSKLTYRRRDPSWRAGKHNKVKPASPRYMVSRPELLHNRPVPRGVPFLRVSMSDLETDSVQLRKAPFVITDGMSDWPMMDTWEKGWRELLKEMWPNAVSDFYPFNMMSDGRNNPYLVRFARAIDEFGKPGSTFHFGRASEHPDKLKGRYMHVQLTPPMWGELEQSGDLPVDRHAFLHNDEWQRSCMSNQTAEEWNLKTHWKIILVGTRGAGMFNHSDSLMTSSWHAHIMGRKWWYVCGTKQDGNNVCYEEVLQPGDILYYPRRWSHETQCLKTPTMTLTDTVAHRGNAEGILDLVRRDCAGEGTLGFKFSSRLCDDLDRCTKWWFPKTKYPSWREIARPGEISKREAIRTDENNYDGRNYILENS